MLSNLSKLCPRCNKSRNTYYVVEKDPKHKKKLWRIERCPACAYNFDIESAGEEIHAPKPKTDIEDDGSNFGRPRGGWLV